ncbi:anti-sigma factor family protein [Paenibacillus glycanilyticus]|uniref:Putative zinc-finger domain-containing protein n=1 Tax=Paenibacillus glycanilyticus TaxID=126569 RepID=A0ABQ6GIP6_9BACL|nr:zf-HC2 domain-containing protein [Paenibacillus glycanilyticus]GLX69198.1 hypothetical protein MU1_35430 [Paenibacillus glycanilyticus]
MTCQEVIEYMNRQLDGDLNEHEYEILIKHTRHCPDCAAMFERLRKLSEELGSLPHVMPKYSLVDAILPQLEQIVPFRQPEAATMELSPSAVTGLSQQTNRRTKERHQLRFRAITGIIAASVAAGLFLVSYNAGLFPTSGSFSDNNSAQTASSDAASSMLDTSKSLKEVQPLANNAGKDSIDSFVEKSDTSEDAKQFYSAQNETGGSEASGNDAGTSNEPASGSNTDSGSVTGEAPSVSANQGGGNSGSEPNQGITGYVPAPLEAASPDGGYIAKAVGYQIHIYKSGEESGKAYYDSVRRNGKIATLVWSADNKQLTYEIQLESGGMERYVVDVKTKTESKAAH